MKFFVVFLWPDPKDSSRVLLAGDMLGIGHSNNGGDQWDSTFGTHVSFDGGVHWKPLGKRFLPVTHSTRLAPLTRRALARWPKK